jgi:hypothetical protein
MRNPIQATADRPIPLPDCILKDAWWTDREAWPRRRAELPLTIVPAQEGQYERRRRQRD